MNKNIGKTSISVYIILNISSILPPTSIATFLLWLSTLSLIQKQKYNKHHNFSIKNSPQQHSTITQNLSSIRQPKNPLSRPEMLNSSQYFNIIQLTHITLTNMNFTYPLFMFQPSMTFQTPFIFFSQHTALQPVLLEPTSRETPKLAQTRVKKEQFNQQTSHNSTNHKEHSKSAHSDARNPQVLQEFHKETQKKKRQIDSFTEKRNIIPNNINHILSYIQRPSKSELIVRKIITRFASGNPKLTPKKFYCYQVYLKQKMLIHVNRETLKELVTHLDLNEDIFTVQEQLFYNKVSRILICYYLKEQAKLKILSSQRVKLTSKIDHLQAQRSLLQYMSQKSDLS